VELADLEKLITLTIAAFVFFPWTIAAMIIIAFIKNKK
tara:strand:- start:1473 stop:1586 length:114 start_codon:yes stop_codon:yes gene_type:complete